MLIKPRTLVWMAGIAVAALLVLWLSRPSQILVDTARAERRALSVTVTEQGRTRARDTFLIAAPISGRLLRPQLEVGDIVSAGSVLARISVPPDDRRAEAIAQANLVAAQARENAADSAVTEAEGNEALTRSELERREELAKKGVTATEELEMYREAAATATARLQNARAAQDAAEAEVARARSQLLGSTPDAEEGILTIKAPVDGKIYHVFEESERVLAAGTPLYALARDNELEIVVDLMTQDAVRVISGQPILLTGWGGEPITGEVRRIEPQAFTKISALGVEEQRVSVIGSLSSVPSGLGAEYRVDVQIEIWRQENVLTVPSSAIFRKDGRWQVFTLEDDRAKLRTVELGQRGSDYVEVVAGLDEGSEVIIYPSDLVADNTLVTNES